MPPSGTLTDRRNAGVWQRIRTRTAATNHGEAAPADWALFDEDSLNDQTWENPYDMAKGHRGFLAGDMVMAMYAWTPNWKALTDAHSIVNLYVRRSFDGGQTWSTLPASFTHTNGITYSGDGNTSCEWMGLTGEQYPVCTTYEAGQFEQARNVSQLLGSQVTVLDPRFSPTSGSITEASVSTDSLPDGFGWGECTGDADEVCDDTRDPSRFFMVFETGETSAYDAGEATPLDLFYSRAVDWGDDYLVWQDGADSSACVPSAETVDLTGFCNEFDAIEGSKLSESGEASVTASPGGMFFYAVWNQWDFTKSGQLEGADAWFRRIMFLDDYIPGDDGGVKGDITLAASGTSKGRKVYANLTWSGATSASVDVVRDAAIITTAVNDGAYTDSLGIGTTGTFVYQICETGTENCSNEATVVFN